MIAIVTLLAAFPIGLLLRSRSTAMITYALVYLWCFVFQSVYLTLEALDPEAADPAYRVGEFPIGYGVVTLGVLLVGFGLVEVGHRVGRRRRRGDRLAAESLHA